MRGSAWELSAKGSVPCLLGGRGLSRSRLTTSQQGPIGSSHHMDLSVLHVRGALDLQLISLSTMAAGSLVPCDHTSTVGLSARLPQRSQLRQHGTSVELTAERLPCASTRVTEDC
jgi:hypothetical protein